MNQSAYKKKLIEVAIPLEQINLASEKEKQPFTKNHPRSLHIWWARRPLTASRAIIFASIVDDPSSHPDKFPSEAAQEMERKRLFRIIEELVKWENSNNEKVLKMARDEIMRSTNGNPPPVLDPFCGGGSIPLEAQRLGLEAHGSDLNPVAVLITKALIEIPPKFAGKQPVNPAYRKAKKKDPVSGAQGLAADVAYYGAWMRQEAEKRIGKYYPKIKLPKEAGGEEASVIAWIWARTVKCPNPACGCEMPIVRSFALSTKTGKEAWVEPIIKAGKPPKIEFVVKTGKGKAPDGVVNRKGATCVACKSPVPFDHVRSEAKSGRMGQRLMAIVAEGKKGRAYLSPNNVQENCATEAKPKWKPDTDLPEKALGFRVQAYGMTKHSQLFSDRQLVALTTFSDLVGEAREQVKKHAIESGLKDDGTSLEKGGTGATAYADAVSIYIALSISKWTDISNSICSWNKTNQNISHLFARHAIPMAWDFSELNPFGPMGSISSYVEKISESILATSPSFQGEVRQQSAEDKLERSAQKTIIVTDPPYYDNIGYADLSDFFYIWLRSSLGNVLKELFSTITTPKSNEMIASQYRHGSKEKAYQFFEDRMRTFFTNARRSMNEGFPLALYYAFKQSEETDSDVNDDSNNSESSKTSTGWQTMLTALVESGFQVTGTWPIRSERVERSIGLGNNALASSVVFVCRPRKNESVVITKKEFQKELTKELIDAISNLRKTGIAPVDLSQAAIGPGMSVYSKYKSVINANGEKLNIGEALIEINRAVERIINQDDTVYDIDTQWAVAWYEQFGFSEGIFDNAEKIARTKNTSIDGLKAAGIVESKSGKIRLIERSDLHDNWDPKKDTRFTVWEAAQYLVRSLESNGEDSAGELLRSLGESAEIAKCLAYRLYSIAEKNKWIEEARAYNALIMSWSEIESLTAA